MGETVLFFRAEGFYPIQLSGTKPTLSEVLDHVELNPDTLKVEDLDGDLLWAPLPERPT